MKKTALEKLAFICSMARYVGYPESPPANDEDEYDESDMDDRGEYVLTYGDLRELLLLVGSAERRAFKADAMEEQELVQAIWKSALLIGRHWRDQEGINTEHMDRHAELVGAHDQKRCDECDPSFGCFSEPDKCCKRAVREREAEIVGHRPKVLGLLQAIEAELSYERDAESSLALAVCLWRRLARWHAQSGEIKIVLVSEGGRHIIAQVHGDDNRLRHEIIDEFGGSHTMAVAARTEQKP